MVYLPTFTINLTSHVGRYTSPMDPIGYVFDHVRTLRLLLTSFILIGARSCFHFNDSIRFSSMAFNHQGVLASFL